MKKLTLLAAMLLIAIAMLMAAAGCGTTQPTPAPGPSPAPAEEITWKCASLFPAEDLCHKVQATTIVNTINERMAGKLHIELYLPDMLVPVMEQFMACSQGVCEATMACFDFDSQWVPEAMVAFPLPRTFETLDQSMKFWHEYGGLEFFRERYAERNMYLYRQLAYGRDCFMSKTLISDLSQMKGLKTWTPAPKAYMFERLGAMPTELPLEELYMGLKLGTLDANIYSVPELKTLNLYEVADYVYLPAIVPVITVNMSFNLDAWNSLSPEMQNELNAIMDEINPQMYNAIAQEETVGLDFFKENGGTIVEWTPAQMDELNQAAWDSWDDVAAVNAKAAEAVDMFRDFLKAEGAR